MKRRASLLHHRAGALAQAAPAVIARRLAMFAGAGPHPSAAVRGEWQRMHHEKLAAGMESAWAMGLEVVAAQQRAWLSWWRSLWRAWAAPPLPWWAGFAPGARRAPGRPPATAARQLRADVLSILNRGLEPVHRRVVANARRLGRPPRR